MLLSKVLQSISNNVLIGAKEEFMSPMNDWIKDNQSKMNKLLQQIIMQGKRLAEKGGAVALSPLSGDETISHIEIFPDLDTAATHDLGEDHGVFKIGKASGNNNNCLIDSIGLSLGIATDLDKHNIIRSNLVDMKLAGKKDFLVNDQKVLSVILQGFGKKPSDVNIYFLYNSLLDEVTYNVGANTTIYIHNEGQNHFSPLVKQ